MGLTRCYTTEGFFFTFIQRYRLQIYYRYMKCRRHVQLFSDICITITHISISVNRTTCNLFTDICKCGWNVKTVSDTFLIYITRSVINTRVSRRRFHLSLIIVDSVFASIFTPDLYSEFYRHTYRIGGRTTGGIADTCCCRLIDPQAVAEYLN